MCSLELIPLSISRGPLIEIEHRAGGFSIDKAMLDKVPGCQLELAAYIEPTIESPRVILGDLLRENYRGSLCYSARPGQWRTDSGYGDRKSSWVVLVYA